MEAYETTDSPIMSYPPISDYSFDRDKLIYYFSRAYRNHCTSCVNRYIFSYKNDVIFISPIRSLYRVCGRTDNFKFIKRSKHFDTYFEGTFEECVNKFNDMLRAYVMLLE